MQSIYNQKYISENLELLGAARVFRGSETYGRIYEVLESTIGNTKALMSMIDSSSMVIDGDGVDRVAKELKSLNIL